MEGTKVIYFDQETEIEAVQKDFINQIYRYKLKGVRDLVNYSDFFIKTDEIIEEIKEIIELNEGKFSDNDNNINLDSDNNDNNIVETIKEIDKIIKKETKPKKSK